MSSHGHGQHEKTDAHAKPLYVFAFWFSVFIVVCLIISVGIFKGLEVVTNPFQPKPHPMAVESYRFVKSEPHLQVNAVEELQAHQNEQDEMLGTYGWVSKEKGLVHIPINKAIDRVLKGGNLPHFDSAE